MPKKIKTAAQDAEACAVDLQLLVRLKAANDEGYCKCVTCGKVAHYKEMQGGHFIERSRSATKLVEENIHPQCQYCNAFGMKSTIIVLEYRNYMVAMYTEDGVAKLIALSRRSHKWVRSEIQEQRADIREQIKYHRKRLGEI